MQSRFLTIILLFFLTQISCAAVDSIEKLEFDPSKYIDVDELYDGMEGYGLTVFHGTQIEKFKVKVISVMSSKTIGRSAFLIKVVDNEIFNVARGVHGCSGSPVFFDGRMAGAMSFGWTFQEEPLYGVTPIRQMLNTYKRVLAAEESKKQDTLAVNSSKVLDKSVYQRLMAPEILNESDIKKLTSSFMAAGQGNSLMAGAEPLPVSLAVSGMSSSAIDSIESYMPGLKLNAGNFTADISHLIKGEKPKLERGSTIVIPLISGDMQAYSLGTVTEVVDDWVFAFGHSFNGNGPCTWPMATGYIHTFMSGKQSSFKIGQAVETVGTVEADEIVAICGRTGIVPETTPAKTIVHFEPIGETIEFNMDMVQDDIYTPLLATMVAIGPAQYRGALPDMSTVEYTVDMDFGEFGKISMSDISSEYSTSHLRSDIMQAASLMISSPWDEVKLKSMKCEITISDKSVAADFKSISLGKKVYYPGETVTADIEFNRFRKDIISQKASIVLPEDLKPGTYDLTIGDKNTYFRTLEMSKPYIDYASNTEDILDVIKIRDEYKRNNIFMFLTRHDSNIALDLMPLEKIPSSKASLLVSQSRTVDLIEYQNMVLSVTPCDYVTYGRQSIQIEIREK